MSFLMIRHSVSDYDAWRQRYDENANNRQAHGINNVRLFRDANNPNEIVTLVESEGLDDAQQIRESPDLLGFTEGGDGPADLNIVDLEEVRPPKPTPERVMQIGGGYMAAKNLFAACELGLFDALTASPRPIDEIAEQLGVDADRLRVIADANVALGFIERRDSGYANSTTAQTYLSRQSPSNLRPLLHFWDRVAYPLFMGLEQAVRTGEGQALDLPTLDAETQEIFSHGVETMFQATANALSVKYDFSRHQRLLDVAGGTGSFLRAIHQRYPDLDLVLFELPGAADVARERLAGQPIDVVAGDMFRDALPAGEDVMLLANVIHLFSPEQNVALFRRLRKALEPDGRVLLIDFWLDESRTSPLMGSLIAGAFMTMTGVGRSYAVEEVRTWLDNSGFRTVEHVPLNGALSLIVGEVA